MQTVAAIGAFTALFAALIGLTQTDIKKVLAYSTVSQLGFMFLAAGAGAFSLAIFHVVTHAFFKALLFLGAGSVIHALGGEQDMRNMGGLRTKLPVTFWTMLCGAAALAGAPFTAGWFSKDPLLGNVLTKAEGDPFFAILYGAALIGALGTAFYTARLIFLTFLGPYRGPEEVAGKIHESPWTMTLPLMLLAIASLAGGALLWTQTPFFRVQDLQSHSAHGINLAATSLALALGVGGAFFLYRIRKAFPPTTDSPNLFHRLSLRKFYFEWFVDRVVTGVFSVGSELIHLLVDVLLIDTLFVSGAGWLARGVGRALARLQTGLVNTYAAWILCGALIMLYVLLR
jgi:NADH-quinone oxidoreductase subunit L